MTLRVLQAGKKLLWPLDVSVEAKTMPLIADDLTCYLHFSLPQLLAAKGSHEDPVRDRKMDSEKRGVTPLNLTQLRTMREAPRVQNQLVRTKQGMVLPLEHFSFFLSRN